MIRTLLRTTKTSYIQLNQRSIIRFASTKHGKHLSVIDDTYIQDTDGSFAHKGKVLTTDTMHPLVKSVEYAVRGALPIRAEALSQVRLKGTERMK